LFFIFGILYFHIKKLRYRWQLLYWFCSAVGKFDWQQGRCYSCLKTSIDILNFSRISMEISWFTLETSSIQILFLFFFTENPSTWDLPSTGKLISEYLLFLTTFLFNRSVLSLLVKLNVLDPFCCVQYLSSLTCNGGTDRFSQNVGTNLLLGST
jgi:hypothetical protein